LLPNVVEDRGGRWLDGFSVESRSVVDDGSNADPAFPGAEKTLLQLVSHFPAARCGCGQLAQA
jgi:hypothetical protein